MNNVGVKNLYIISMKRIKGKPELHKKSSFIIVNPKGEMKGLVIANPVGWSHAGL